MDHYINILNVSLDATFDKKNKNMFLHYSVTKDLGRIYIWIFLRDTFRCSFSYIDVTFYI